MNIDDTVTVNSGEPSWDGPGTITEVDPPVMTEAWVFVQYDDGRAGFVPARYVQVTDG